MPRKKKWLELFTKFQVSMIRMLTDGDSLWNESVREIKGFEAQLSLPHKGYFLGFKLVSVSWGVRFSI